MLIPRVWDIRSFIANKLPGSFKDHTLSSKVLGNQQRIHSLMEEHRLWNQSPLNLQSKTHQLQISAALWIYVLI